MTRYDVVLADIDSAEEHSFEVEAEDDRHAISAAIIEAIAIEGEQAFTVVSLTAIPDLGEPATTEPAQPLDPLVEEPEELVIIPPIIEAEPEPEGGIA